MALRVHQSAKMREAQAYFQQVVKRELQELLDRGAAREAAVRTLLHRIVATMDEPDDADVQRVMRQFQMNHEDAVRALIVKQEIGRLKRQGLDAFAAIEELTRKMQCPVERAEAEEAKTMEVEEEEARKEEEKEEEKEVVSRTHDAAGSAVENAEATTPSLCQRIGQVSISTLPRTRVSTEAEAKAEERREDSPRATFARFSSHSLKRRAQRSASPSPSPERDDDTLLTSSTSMIRDSTSSNGSNGSNGSDSEVAEHKHEDARARRNRHKKQRLWDRVSDSFARAVSLKNTVVAPASPTAVSARDDEDDEEQPQSQSQGPSRGKRPRSASQSSPLFDLMTLGDALFQQRTKRHKS